MVFEDIRGFKMVELKITGKQKHDLIIVITIITLIAILLFNLIAVTYAYTVKKQENLIKVEQIKAQMQEHMLNKFKSGVIINMQNPVIVTLPDGTQYHAKSATLEFK
jgi:hypothetical protein